MRRDTIVLIALIMIVTLAGAVSAEKMITDKGTYVLEKEDKKEVDMILQEKMDEMYDASMEPAVEEPKPTLIESLMHDPMMFYIAAGAFVLIILSVVIFAIKNMGAKKEKERKPKQKRSEKKEKTKSRPETSKDAENAEQSTDILKKYGLYAAKEKMREMSAKDTKSTKPLKEDEQQNPQSTDILKKYGLYKEDAENRNTTQTQETKPHHAEHNPQPTDILKKYGLYKESSRYQRDESSPQLTKLQESTQKLHEESLRVSDELKEEKEAYEKKKFTSRDLMMRRAIIDALRKGENSIEIELMLERKGYKESEIKHHMQHIKKTLELNERLEKVSKSLSRMYTTS